MSDLETRVQRLEDDVREIEERNRRVEANKAWETSLFRKLWVLLLTYLVTALVFRLIGVPRFMLNALIPTLAYWMSTASLPFARAAWQGTRRKPPDE